MYLDQPLAAQGSALSGRRKSRLGAKELVRLLASGCCQFVLHFMSRPYAASPGTTIVFAPHQDDETLGCGALIARKRTDGQSVHVAFLTDGAASHPSHPRVTRHEIAAIRLQESRQVLAVLGVDSRSIHYFNEPDGTLDAVSAEHRESLVVRLAALLVELQPTEIFVPCRGDGSTEHEAALGLVLAAVERSGWQPIIWEYPIWLWWNTRALLKRVVRARGWARAPTEDYLPVKRRALARYRSQLEPLPPQDRPSLPPALVRVLDSEAEYFFRYVGPSQAAVSLATPMPKSP